MDNTLQKIGVVGCGLMGAGIAEVCARAGSDVIVVESSRGARRRGTRPVGEVAAPRGGARPPRQCRRGTRAHPRRHRAR
ncbi:3-hydroxyacyl-CoA dehydrogenase NAD-binding domain-containing protein [Janibacter limosus]|uniref:3-hydroxyacyl-CoA dehydrogenase NAD-binding domain-containing protein n=1 Tax=Janibacter limosus TaxID=53458 RepID=UPI0035E30A69